MTLQPVFGTEWTFGLEARRLQDHKDKSSCPNSKFVPHNEELDWGCHTSDLNILLLFLFPQWMLKLLSWSLCYMWIYHLRNKSWVEYFIPLVIYSTYIVFVFLPNVLVHSRSGCSASGAVGTQVRVSMCTKAKEETGCALHCCVPHMLEASAWHHAGNLLLYNLFIYKFFFLCHIRNK